jgi:hypothetical protein
VKSASLRRATPEHSAADPLIWHGGVRIAAKSSPHGADVAGTAAPARRPQPKRPRAEVCGPHARPGARQIHAKPPSGGSRRTRGACRAPRHHPAGVRRSLARRDRRHHGRSAPTPRGPPSASFAAGRGDGAEAAPRRPGRDVRWRLRPPGNEASAASAQPIAARESVLTRAVELIDKGRRGRPGSWEHRDPARQCQGRDGTDAPTDRIRPCIGTPPDMATVRILP